MAVFDLYTLHQVHPSSFMTLYDWNKCEHLQVLGNANQLFGILQTYILIDGTVDGVDNGSKG